jgi:hypothetical protein
MKALLDSVDFDLISLEDLGDPAEAAAAFTNVNTVAEGMKVEAILERRRKGVSSPGPEQGRGPR